ncbi:MAG TPA: ATP-grasp domain-containing protein [Candidatus Paceibacterota bacterium]|jgi:predicted ATP-grasp superfamily ATP-dependent carboligase|nr:ATP-grasp domain-containing protein [Candidatus Paceibacterota bacterium]
MAKSVKNPVILYVTRDIERALGAQPTAEYQIVANKTAYAESVKKLYPDFIHLIETTREDGELFDTRELLDHESVRRLIATRGADNVSIVVFKNTPHIEQICTKNAWHLANPSSTLAEKIENKMTQVEYLGALGETYLPPHSLTITKDIVWNKKPLIIQWAHSHTGLGTTLVNSADELKAVQEKFPERLARVTSYVHGPSFTLNVVIDEKNIFLGNISYQITGIPPFTENLFTTIGNDWSLTHSLLDETEISAIETMATDVARKLQSDGWRGLFGIDVMRDDELNKIFLIEINARQPASTTYESELQRKNRELGVDGQTIFEAHVKALTGGETTGTKSTHIIPINDGSQIIQRITRITQSISDKQIQALGALGHQTILYPNVDENADLLRIQSLLGIMETHGRFNKRGKEIVDVMSAQ